MQIWLCRDGEIEPPMVVTLWNLSESGIGLIHSDVMQRGQQFLIGIPGSTDFRLLYTIVRIRKSNDGSFVLGAKFIARVPTELEAQGKALQKFRGCV